MTKQARSFRSGSGRRRPRAGSPRRHLAGPSSCAGIMALSALLDSVLTLADAGGPDARSPSRIGPLRQRQAATPAPVPLALVAAPIPTAILTVTTAAANPARG